MSGYNCYNRERSILHVDCTAYRHPNTCTVVFLKPCWNVWCVYRCMLSVDLKIELMGHWREGNVWSAAVRSTLHHQFARLTVEIAFWTTVMYRVCFEYLCENKQENNNRCKCKGWFLGLLSLDISHKAVHEKYLTVLSFLFFFFLQILCTKLG